MSKRKIITVVAVIILAAVLNGLIFMNYTVSLSQQMVDIQVTLTSNQEQDSFWYTLQKTFMCAGVDILLVIVLLFSTRSIGASHRGFKSVVLYLTGLKRSHAVFLVITLILLVLRVWLSYNAPVYAITGAIWDDRALMDMTLNLLQGNWLGEYSQYVLMKGITYSLFCAFFSLLRIPYSIWLPVFNIIAAVVFLRAVKRIIRNINMRYLFLLIFVYSPITFDFGVTQRLYRNALSAPLVLLIFAGVLGVYLNIRNSKKSAAYSVLAGVSLFLFWNLREDSIWIMPFVIVSGIITVVFLIYSFLRLHDLKRLIKKMAIIVMPFIIFFCGNKIVCGINYVHYGVFTTNDRTDTAFNDVLSLFIKIDYEENDPDLDPEVCYMSYAKYEYIIDHSESLSKYKEIFLDVYADWAESEFGGEYVNGDHLQWILRYGLVVAGYYTDAVEVQNYLNNVKEELETEIENGNLEVKSGLFLSGSTGMLELNEIPDYIRETIVKTMPKVLLYKETNARVGYSVGTDEELQKWEQVVESMIIYPDESDSDDVNRATKVISFENKIIRVYQILAIPVNLLAFLSLGFLTVLQIPNVRRHNRKLFDQWFVSVSAILSCFVSLFIYTIFEYMDLNVTYFCSGAFEPVMIFQMVAIYSAVGRIFKCKKRKVISAGINHR